MDQTADFTKGSVVEMKAPASQQMQDDIGNSDHMNETESISEGIDVDGFWEQYKKTIVYSLCYLYWLAAIIWDYQSGVNHRRDSSEAHYSAWVLHVFFGFMTLYLQCSYYNKTYCADLDDAGRDKDGKVRRPDIFLRNLIENASPMVQMILSTICVLGWIIWIMIECGNDTEKWQCFLGLLFFVTLAVAISWHPSKVKWRPVLFGLFLQWVFGYIVLNTTWGYDAFDWLSDQVTEFLNYSNVGAEFVFGGDIFNFYTFAFYVLPTVTWFSAAVYFMYHAGIIQFFISGIAFVMQATLGTSASESLSAAGNIFVGQTEAPLLVRPYLDRMTESEINAVMTGGFATIAGGVLGLFISFGVDAHHLMAASFMSAPAALAVAKIVLPELNESETAAGKNWKVTPEMIETNGLLDALTQGTLISITLVANICALLITFLGLIDFANNVIGYLGERIGFVGDSALGYTKICGYLFYPLSWFMGVPADDCLLMGELLGYKIFINELVAYTEMGCMYSNGEIGSRCAFMATYALCGFSNFGSIGVQIGGLSPLAPNNKDKLLKVALRAMIAGNIACFMTACIAGILIDVDAEQAEMSITC